MSNYITTNLNDWCARSDIDPSDLLRIVDALKIDGCGWIAGGAVRRTLMNKPLDSDFDLFFASPEAMAIWIGNRKPPSLQLVRETEHHKHFRGTLPGSELPIDVQAIHFRYYDNARQVIESFDYTICMFALSRGGVTSKFNIPPGGSVLVDLADDEAYQLVTTDEALWDLGRIAGHRRPDRAGQHRSQVRGLIMPRLDDGTGYQNTDTSMQSAQQVSASGRAAILKQRVLGAFHASPFGMTADECAAILGESVLSIRPTHLGAEA